ncbi:MAG: hypothetical protein ACYDBB_01445 [Armatimonadota bacterium]
MTVVINKLFQPLTYQTASGAGLHLLPRGRVTVPEREMSEELLRAAQRGFIVLEADAPSTDDPVSTPDAKATRKKEG